MEAKMQMIDYYLTEYNFILKRKISQQEKCSIGLNVGCRALKPEKHNDKILAGIELHADITINNDENEKELGKIIANIRGIFTFDKSISEDEMQNLLKINGSTIVYQQLRAYINANTALCNSVPNIILPVINFSDINEKKDSNN